MPRNVAVTIENNFVNGQVTDFTALNFPENAVTESQNCVFDHSGEVSRRLGFVFEDESTPSSMAPNGGAHTNFVWRNATAGINIVVTQIGNFLRFYVLSNNTTNISVNLHATVFDLRDISVGGPDPSEAECQFAAGSGRLFIVHPTCNPLMLSYVAASNVFTVDVPTLKIRDVVGLEEPGVLVDERPLVLTATHEYNIRNQGWAQSDDTGDTISAADRRITGFFTDLGVYPSNADVWWIFKDHENLFDPATTALNVSRGNSPAPRGLYVLDAFNEDRSTVSGVAGLPVVTSDFYRPSTAEFFAGRIFYGGVDAPGYENTIYFSQILENNSQAERCYQVNDPTSEELSTLLPSDGGTIKIAGLGRLLKLMAVGNSLCAFGSNGVWAISGSTGIGFTANDYSVKLIAEFRTLSATSFVRVAGFPAWWNEDSINILVENELGSLQLKSITDKKMARFYRDIPLESKRYARGAYNPVLKLVQWLYSSEAPETMAERYQYDRVLNFDVLTSAMYTWTAPSASNVLTGILSLEGDTFKYFTRIRNTSNYTFSETGRTDHLDWGSVDATSHFVTGYKIRGDAMKKTQVNYLNLFFDNTVPSSVNVQAQWNFANTADTNRWSSTQNIVIFEDDYDAAFRRLKIRGHGIACQFKFSSVLGEPFNIIGWTGFETGNTNP